jgi:hypothetical protein
MRSSSRSRSRSRRLPRVVTSLAMIAMPLISPDLARSGNARALTKIREPSTCWTANVPSQVLPVPAWADRSLSLRASPGSNPTATSERPTMLAA